jgi:hypothetical protein
LVSGAPTSRKQPADAGAQSGVTSLPPSFVPQAIVPPARLAHATRTTKAVHPQLIATLGDVERAWLRAPTDMRPRAWLLAVMAVQVAVVEDRLEALFRINQTGWDQPDILPLGKAEVVHVALTGATPAPAPPALAAPSLGSAAARITVHVDGRLAGESVLAPGACGLGPPPRAFGHVFARWLRDGGHESGFDLTAFQPGDPGTRFARRARGRLRPPTVVSFGVALA